MTRQQEEQIKQELKQVKNLQNFIDLINKYFDTEEKFNWITEMKINTFGFEFLKNLKTKN